MADTNILYSHRNTYILYSHRNTYILFSHRNTFAKDTFDHKIIKMILVMEIFDGKGDSPDVNLFVTSTEVTSVK